MVLFTALENGSGIEENDLCTAKTARRNKSSEKKQQIADNALNRSMGKEYLNYKKLVVPEKKLKPRFCADKRCNNECHSFDENSRQALLNDFWGLASNKARKIFLSDLIVPVEIKRRRSRTNKRQISRQYYLLNNNIKHRVCQQFILDTLCISQKFLKSVKIKDIFSTNKRAAHFVPAETQKSLTEFIDALPVVSSHYCRASSSKKYLPSEYESEANVYRIYCKLQRSKNIEPVSKSTFTKTFKNDYNIGIHAPKKDKCSSCEKFKNVSEKTDELQSQHDQHIQEKELCLKTFSDEQQASKTVNSKVVVASMDLQKILSTPHGDSMMLYYTRKYAVYNLTIYDSSTRDGFCYVWGESDGMKGGNEVATCLMKYLHVVDERKIEHVSLYCDNCYGQNKNRLVMSAIYHFLETAINIVEITVTFLVAGHTYMTVDSCHAVIDRHMKKKIVWAPSEWATLIRNARINPRPYIVTEMTYDSFLNFKNSINNRTFTKNVENEKILLSQIRQMKLKKNSNVVEYRYSLIDDTVHKAVFTANSKKIDKAYNTKIPIAIKKYNDLTNLCKNGIIPKVFHHQYMDMPHCAKEVTLDSEEEN